MSTIERDWKHGYQEVNELKIDIFHWRRVENDKGNVWKNLN